MYEVVKVVNGYEIYKLVGSRNAYHINIREGRGFREYHTFKTLKAATQFAESL